MNPVAAIVQAVAGVVTGANNNANAQYLAGQAQQDAAIGYARAKDFNPYQQNRLLTITLAAILIAGLLIIAVTSAR